MDNKSMPQPLVGPLNIFGITALAGIVGPLVLVVASAISSFSEPEYDIIRDSISSLALTTLGWIQTIGFLAIGLLVEIFVAGLLFNIRKRRGFTLSMGLLVFVGFGLLLIGAFKVDPVGATHTIEGTIHSVVAAAVFWLFPIAILLVAHSIRNDPNWKGLFIYTVVAGALALVFMVSRLGLPSELSWFGLYERILVLNIVAWIEVMAVRLLCMSLRGEFKGIMNRIRLALPRVG